MPQPRDSLRRQIYRRRPVALDSAGPATTIGTLTRGPGTSLGRLPKDRSR